MDFTGMDLQKLAEHVPFLMTTADGRTKMNWMRLFEVGVVLGMLYVQVDGLKTELKEVKTAVEQIRHDLYVPKAEVTRR